VRNQKQSDELRDCTFQPVLHLQRRKEPRGGCIVVPGLSGHLEKQAAARRQASELQAKLDRIFIAKPKDPRSKFTVSRPFVLSSDSPVRVE
jgi:hypothetical protein